MKRSTKLNLLTYLTLPGVCLLVPGAFTNGFGWHWIAAIIAVVVNAEVYYQLGREHERERRARLEGGR